MIGKGSKRVTIVLLAALLLTAILMVLNMALGSVHVPLSEVVSLLFTGESSNVVFDNIVLKTRLPQTLVSVGAGMALGVAGLLMQTLFKNPLAGPSVLGISSGASLGVAFVMLFSGQFLGFSFYSLGWWGDFAVILSSFLGAGIVLLLILFISSRIGGTLSVLIIGVMIGYLSSSLVGLLKFYSTEEDVHNYVIWGLGSFSRMSAEKAWIFSLVTIALSISSLALSKSLNLLSLGDRYAINLGLKLKRARFGVIASAGFLTALVTSFCGPVIFIGVAVPHLAKLLSRTANHYHLVINAAVIGGATALLCNLVARLPGLEQELPINSVTAFVGAPVVIWVIWKGKRNKE
ncbi:iron ABC transporter permease [Marinilabilia salmonicolor]|jgi:iron complex transport system permease protein|uniref:Iron complex transport system permease protein n=1 Tax=Marinilabilia salmonicolor TaxID=989 RepID=A0A2T0XBD5_9BACT|nr:iron ABC transporter permease [Marinilabilia salmonicolor]PRY96219.1 iron complex transport system permease protein [Marinilabilia salmonicolor]RCW35313.1 iron complex transport system permease protein [Marinilabilia salmonicolor]